MSNLTKKRIKDATKGNGALSQNQATQIKYEGTYGGGLSKILPRVDKLLKFKPDLAEAYEDIMNDGHLQGLIGSRKSGTLSLDWDLQADKVDKAITEFIYKFLDKLKMYQLIDTILDARLFGMQPIELIYDNVDDNLIPVKEGGGTSKWFVPLDISGRPFQWFGFDNENNLRFMAEEAGEDGEECHPDKYLVPKNDASYNNPYGVGLLSMCYWNVYFKKHGKDYWAEFCEKFGSPWVIGSINEQATDEEKATVQANLTNIISSNTMVKSNNWDLDVKLNQSKQSGDTFEQFINDCKSENAIIFLGHEASTQSTPGKLGNDQNALSASERLIQGDKRLVQDTINDLIKTVCKLNFPNAIDIPYFIFFEEENLNLDKATRDKLLYDMGFDFTPEYMEKAYSFDKGQIFKRELTATAAPSSNTNAEGNSNFFNFSSSIILNQKITKKNHKLLDELIDHVKSDKDSVDYLEKMLVPIFKHKGKDLKELKKNYFKLFKDINGSKYQDYLTRVVNICDIIGYDAAYREEQPKLSEQNNGAYGFFNRNPDDITFEDILEALSKTPEEAVKYFKSKGLKISDNAKERIKAIKEHGFTVTGVTKLDILNDYKDMLVKAIEEGITLSEFKKQLGERLATRGWFTKDEDNGELPPWRLNNIYRTNTAEVYNNAKWSQFQETKDLIPFIECYSVIDKNTTDKCKWLNGKTFRKDDLVFAKKARSGGHFGCRRTDIPSSDLDAKGKKIWKGSEIPAKHLNDKEFYKQDGGFTPDLTKYDDDLTKEYKKVHK
jgi:SPP1 gp7 family putative phage head morphogenesis protein